MNFKAINKCLFVILVFLSIPCSAAKHTFQLGSEYSLFFQRQLYRYRLNQKISTDYKLAFSAEYPEEHRFFSLLNKHLQTGLTKDHLLKLKNIPTHCFSMHAAWNPVNWNNQRAYCSYHTIIQELSQEILPKVFKDLDIETPIEMPVIHYRLNDVPFCRNMSHHLQYYQFYIQALKKIKTAGIDTTNLLVVYTFSHRKTIGSYSSNQLLQLNKAYLSDFIKYLNEHGHVVHLQSKTALIDFATMISAPALISSTGCYSYFAALGNKNLVVSPLIGRESKGSFPKIQSFSFMLPVTPLLHAIVKNYNDVHKVFNKLRSPLQKIK